MTKTKVLLSWSSGKDSAWALHTLRQDPTIEVVGLFTTLNQAFERRFGVTPRLFRVMHRTRTTPQPGRSDARPSR